MKDKKVIYIIVFVLLIILLLIIFANSKEIINEEIQTEETTNKIAIKKENETYEIYNTDINTNNGLTKITATIKNVSGTKTSEQIIEIVLLDKQNNELGTIKASVPSLDNEVATEISAESLKIYQNIYDYKVK